MNGDDAINPNMFFIECDVSFYVYVKCDVIVQTIEDGPLTVPL